MREIRFRAYCKKTKYMCYRAHDCYDTLGCNAECGFGGYVSSFGDLLTEEDIILMQYTGLKDKNGKEIYEKDILRANKANPYWYGFDKYKGIGGLYIMEFIEGCFTFMRGQHITQDTIEFWDLEVIGNVWENPELLTT